MQFRSNEVPVLQFCTIYRLYLCSLTFPIFLFVLSLEIGCLNMGALP
ncbi:hypothetical protein Nmel_005851, partial [Mimus melanotis]